MVEDFLEGHSLLGLKRHQRELESRARRGQMPPQVLGEQNPSDHPSVARVCCADTTRKRRQALANIGTPTPGLTIQIVQHDPTPLTIDTQPAPVTIEHQHTRQLIKRPDTNE